MANLIKCCDETKFAKCRALIKGHCVALNETNFKDNDCPFFSERKRQEYCPEGFILRSDIIKYLKALLKCKNLPRAVGRLSNGDYFDATPQIIKEIIDAVEDRRE